MWSWLRIVLVAVLLSALAWMPVVPAVEAETVQEDRIVVAVLDTGIRPTHESFGNDQIVAWYDFGRSASPNPYHPTTTWDPRVDPYDDNGHGTAVAALVGGTGAHTPSHAPGVDLAIAKISFPDGGASWQHTRRAIEWAVDVVQADVISLSFYAYYPQFTFNHQLLQGLEYARENGVLPVVLSGNGLGNFGTVPTANWMHPPASSPHALVVGGASSTGTPTNPFGSLEPEVTALYKAVVPSHDSDQGYYTGAGTSFSTPLVAGMAASLLETAAVEGLPAPDPDHLESLLKRSVQTTLHPPQHDGYGYLDVTQLEVARTHLRAGTDPPLSIYQVPKAYYVENVQQLARWTWYGQPGNWAPWTP